MNAPKKIFALFLNVDSSPQGWTSDYEFAKKWALKFGLYCPIEEITDLSTPPKRNPHQRLAKGFVGSLLLLFVVLLSGCAWFKNEPTDVPPNFSQVSTNVFRGGQPTTLAQWSFLKMHGVTDVIKLNNEKGDELAAQFGITVHTIYISGWKQFFGPVDVDMCNAYTTLQDSRKVWYVHCQHGENRTGTLIILYRMYDCKWSKEDAIAEANKFKWNTSFPALKSFIKNL